MKQKLKILSYLN